MPCRESRCRHDHDFAYSLEDETMLGTQLYDSPRFRSGCLSFPPQTDRFRQIILGHRRQLERSQVGA